MNAAQHWARFHEGPDGDGGATVDSARSSGPVCACRSDSQPTSTGGLVVIVASDLALPADIDRITVDATQVNSTLLHEDRKAARASS